MQIAIVTNTLAGNGKAIKLSNKIQLILSSKNILSKIFVETEWNNNIHNYDQAWIVGGDGTVNYFVNRYLDIKIPLAIFNGGTGNDFYALLYGNQKLETQIDFVLKTTPRAIDAGKCNERYFLNGVGIGFEGAVVKNLIGVKKFGGKTSFMMAILRQIFFYKEQSYTIKCEEKIIENKFLMISIANGTRYGGGFYVAPLAKADDGLLDANLVQPLSVLKRLRYLPVIEKGKHLSKYFIEYFNTKKITIASNQIIQAHLDGEYLEASVLQIEILPAQFNFIY